MGGQWTPATALYRRLARSWILPNTTSKGVLSRHEGVDGLFSMAMRPRQVIRDRGSDRGRFSQMRALRIDLVRRIPTVCSTYPR